MTNTVLIIDDDQRFAKQLAFALAKEGYAVEKAYSGSEAKERLQHSSYHCVISDVQLPDSTGIALIEQIKSLDPLCEVVVLTAFGSIEDGVAAMKAGAMDYSVKTSALEHILLLVQRACEKSQLAYQVQELSAQITNRDAFASIIGSAQTLQAVVAMARTIAPTSINVLLLGETGTGKEMFAHAIHLASLQTNGDFVAVNCSAIPSELLESELFGHTKGAFTGASHDKIGLLTRADGGTLFLDEIGDMPSLLQTKILRTLEAREFTPIGGTKAVSFDARLIAATNAQIYQKIADGSFRSDLYYRLEGFVLTLPPLRERIGDVEVLAQYFLTIFTAKYKKRVRSMTEDFRAKLLRYPWYGNVRELRNAMERAVLLCPHETLMADLLTMPSTAHPLTAHLLTAHPPPRPTEYVRTTDNTATIVNTVTVNNEPLLNERNRILHALQLSNGERKKTAELLGISVATLYRKLHKYNVPKYQSR